MALLSLFTTPASAPQPTTNGGVTEAVRHGAERSGAGFDFLLRTAQRESAMDPEAKAATSSATGLFQFIDQTWLTTVKSDGAKHGLQRYADAITINSGGRATVADPALRAEILALRRDPKVSAALAGELANRNGASLADTLGRPATQGELYLAHVMGARGATSLIRRSAATPDEKAAGYFPDEAAANRGIFYTRDGRARTLAEVRQILTSGFDASAPAAVAAAAPAASGAWLSFFPQTAGQTTTRPIDGLFRTEGPRGPVSPAVARLWAPRAATQTAASYFPAGSGEVLPPPERAAPSKSASTTSTSSSTSTRPAATAATPATTAATPAPAKRRQRAPGKPLDLQALMKPVAT